MIDVKAKYHLAKVCLFRSSLLVNMTRDYHSANSCRASGHRPDNRASTRVVLRDWSVPRAAYLSNVSRTVETALTITTRKTSCSVSLKAYKVLWVLHGIYRFIVRYMLIIHNIYVIALINDTNQNSALIWSELPPMKLFIKCLYSVTWNTLVMKDSP